MSNSFFINKMVCNIPIYTETHTVQICVLVGGATITDMDGSFSSLIQAFLYFQRIHSSLNLQDWDYIFSRTLKYKILKMRK